MDEQLLVHGCFVHHRNGDIVKVEWTNAPTAPDGCETVELSEPHHELLFDMKAHRAHFVEDGMVKRRVRTSA